MAEGGTEGGILNTKLIDEGSTFFPATVCFICRGEGGIEELRPGLEGLDMSMGRMRGRKEKKKVSGLTDLCVRGKRAGPFCSALRAL